MIKLKIHKNLITSPTSENLMVHGVDTQGISFHKTNGVHVVAILFSLLKLDARRTCFRRIK